MSNCHPMHFKTISGKIDMTIHEKIANVENQIKELEVSKKKLIAEGKEKDELERMQTHWNNKISNSNCIDQLSLVRCEFDKKCITIYKCDILSNGNLIELRKSIYDSFLKRCRCIDDDLYFIMCL